MELDLKDYIRVIRKRIWILITLLLLFVSTAAIYSFVIATPIYQATTKLIVNKASDTVNLGQQLTLSDVNMNISLINTYKEIIKTTYIMNIVAKENPDLNLTASELIKKVKVNSVNQTQVMTVSVQDESYEKAVKIVNAIAETFKTEIVDIIKVDNVSILDKAKPNMYPEPVSPQKLVNIVIGIMLGLIFGIGIILLLEYLDDTIKTEEDIREILQLPTLSMIMTFDNESENDRKNKRSRVKKGGWLNVLLRR